MQSTINQTESKVLHRLEFYDDLEVLQAPVPYIEFILDDDLSKDLPDMIAQPEYKDKKDDFALQVMLMADLLEASSTDEMVEKADQRFTEIAALYQENQKTILAEIRETEQTLRSLQLFFKNASEDGEVENAWFMTVDPQYFAGTTNPKHFNELVTYLQSKFYAWRLRESPSFISYVGDIGNGAMEMAKVAMQTLGLAVADVMDARSPQAVLERTAMKGLRGIEEYWGHLVVAGTWLIGRKAYEGLEQEALPIGSAAPVLGKLLATCEGDSAAGFESGALANVQGVRFKSDTRDSKKFSEQGMILIGWEDGCARIFGDATACQADNEDLRKISKMMVSNGILKDLVDFCNLKAYSKWGRKEKADFKTQLENYLNDCIRHGKIQRYCNVEVMDINSDEVDINVEIVYYETKSQYNIKISGAKGHMDVEATKQ